jgi:hypothetical protein
MSRGGSMGPPRPSHSISPMFQKCQEHIPHVASAGVVRAASLAIGDGVQ